MKRRHKGRTRLYVGLAVGLVLAVVLAMNGHMLYVAVSSQPDCAEATIMLNAQGEQQELRPAKVAC